MDKLRFDFVVKAAGDGKTNVIALTSIGTQENRNFIMPAEYQAMNLHTILEKNKSLRQNKEYAKKKAPEERNMDNSYRRFEKKLI